VLAAVIDLRPVEDVARRGVIDPGTTPAADQVSILETQLARLGIPMARIASEPAAHSSTVGSSLDANAA
jgi:hypothetical protein